MNKHEELELCIKWAHNAQGKSEIPEVKRLFGVCEAALCEKLERGMGCGFCRGEKRMSFGPEDSDDDIGVDIEYADGRLTVTNGDGDWLQIVFPYCPLCGRKLDSTAQDTTTL